MPGEPPGSSDPPDPAGLVGRAAEADASFADGSLLLRLDRLREVNATT